jgi:hypothetical protein
MTRDEESIKNLEESWTQPGGFLFELTEGKYEIRAGEAFIARLHDIKYPQGKTISRRLVNVLWQIPSYLSDHRPDILENGGDVVAFDQLQLMVNVFLDDLLGGPPLDKAIAAMTETLEKRSKTL